jgi:hypothetical protein
MTFAEVSAQDHDAVSALVQCLGDELRMHHARTHYPDDSHIGRVLHSRRTGQIGGGIGAPVASEGNDFGFKTHYNTPL